MQRERRHNPYPWTWEIPTAVVLLVVLVLAVGVHLGNGLAHLVRGEGWWWPHPTEVFTTIPTVFTHDPAWGWIATVEAVLIGVVGWLLAAGWRRWGPSRVQGMATPEQAEQVLGVTRLRKVAPIVRPDLYPPTTSRRPR